MVNCAAADRRAKWRVQAFCQGQNLGAGGIHFRRAWNENRGPHGASPVGNYGGPAKFPVGNYGGPAKEAVEQQIANIKAFVEERTHE